MAIKIGVAGWTVPVSHRAPKSMISHLEQYAAHFDCVEINSSFYKPHRVATFERWASCVPPDFQFAAKVPKVITHEQRLISCNDALDRFCASVAGLAQKLAVLLIQLPPSLSFDEESAESTLRRLKRALSARIVLEARHLSWFDPPVDRFLADLEITRVFADPRVGGPSHPPIEATRFSYLRLHGKPRVYYSSYSAQALHELARELEPAVSGADAWCVFDNTALGAAWPNALKIKEQIAGFVFRGQSSVEGRGCMIE